MLSLFLQSQLSVSNVTAGERKDDDYRSKARSWLDSSSGKMQGRNAGRYLDTREFVDE
jgi:uncharacterized protein YraI